MIEIKVINKINEKIEEYQSNTGATKTWIAKQLGYNSPQALDKAMKNASNSVETYAKFAYFLGEEPHDLYAIDIVDKNS